MQWRFHIEAGGVQAPKSWLGPKFSLEPPLIVCIALMRPTATHVCLSGRVFVTRVSCATVVEPIDMLFKE